MLVQLIIISFSFSFIFFFIISGTFVIKSAGYCIRGTTTKCASGFQLNDPIIDYPFWIEDHLSTNNCSSGDPQFRIRCAPSSGRLVMNISNNLYYVQNIDFVDRRLTVMDVVTQGQLCPQPRRNFSITPFLDYDYNRDRNMTIFYNCTGYPQNVVQHLPCLQKNHTGGGGGGGLPTGLKIVSGVIAGVGGLLLLFLIIYRGIFHSLYNLVISHWMNKIKSPINMEAFLESCGCVGLQRYKYKDIKKIMNSFKETLGQGGYGCVFKGKLRDSSLVVVKVLNESKGIGEEFLNEVATIGRTNHVNVVNLMGFCIEGTKGVLVYEYMQNGSLEKFIYNNEKNTTNTSPPLLGWEKIYEIALGIARGLEYLHRGCNTRILHLDIKPHNILLDKEFRPKISDFGLAKLCPTSKSDMSIIGARGTMGYIAPEVCSRNFGGVSHKSDVYSYGMMLLEMIGGRKNIDTTVENISEVYFPDWIHSRVKQDNMLEKLEEVVDEGSKDNFEGETTKKMIIVALWCIQAHPTDRPSMKEVCEMLEGRIGALQMPPNPSSNPRSISSTLSS